MTTTAKVTVGLPFLDEYETFRRAVRSVFAQTTADWHLILIQEGSDPALRELATTIRDDRVSFVSDGDRRGLAARLNQITRLASTDIVVRMDADDVMTPNRLERTITELATRESPVVASQAYVIDEETRVCGLYIPPPTPVTDMDYLMATPFIHPTIAGLRSWFLDNPYDETIRRAEDKELWLRTRHEQPVRTLADPLLFYRVPFEIAVPKLLRTSRDDRIVMRTLRRDVVTGGRDGLRYRTRLLRSYAVDAASLGASAFGKTAWIARRKYVQLGTVEQEKVGRILRSTYAPVPGWD